MPRRTLPLLALVALLAMVGCKKDSNGSSSTNGNGNGNGSGASSAGAAAAGETVADFPSTDANTWVNGSSVKLGDLRGDVVLVEAWHRQ